MKKILYTIVIILCFGLTCQYRLDTPKPSQEITLDEMNIALEHEVIYTITDIREEHGMIGFVIPDSLMDVLAVEGQDYTFKVWNGPEVVERGYYPGTPGTAFWQIHARDAKYVEIFKE